MLLFLQNIKSLGANYDELIATFQANQIMPPLLALTETWLKDYSNNHNQLFCNESLQKIVTCNRPKKGWRSSSAREQKISINNNKDLCKQWHTSCNGILRFKKSVFCSNDSVQGSTNGYINIPKLSSGTSFCHGTKNQSHFTRGLKYRFL